MHYNPEHRVAGVDYYSVGQLINIVREQCPRPEVQDICENALIRKPYGLELRNEYLLPIRTGLQEWKSGVTISLMIKLIFTRLLNDTVEGGVFPYEQLRLSTIVAFDPSTDLTEAIHNF